MTTTTRFNNKPPKNVLIDQHNSPVPLQQEEDDPEYLVLTFDNNSTSQIAYQSKLAENPQVRATTRLTARLTNSTFPESLPDHTIEGPHSVDSNEGSSIISESASSASSHLHANSNQLRPITYYKHYSEPKATTNSKMLKCIECGKYYRNQYSLRHHICLKRKDVWRKGDVPSRMVDGHLTYFCPICYKPFKWLGNLTRHFYVHTGQRFFKCNMCDKEFFSAYQVKRHMNSHTGVRFKCEICDRAFTCKYACAWHTRQHFNPEATTPGTSQDS